MGYCLSKGIGKIIVVTKIDGENIDYQALLDSIKNTLGSTCIPLVLPIGTGHDFKGVANIFELSNLFPVALWVMRTLHMMIP